MAKVKTIICPECGKELRAAQIQSHVHMHWGDSCPDRIRYRLASERYMFLIEFAIAEEQLFQMQENTL